ncbi:excinuclease ABC subunit UvrC [Streptacidiphilus monticola]
MRLHGRARRHLPQAAGVPDARGGRGDGVREGGPAARRHGGAAPRDGEERRRPRRRHGRGPARGGRGRAGSRRADLPRPRRPGARPARLGDRQGRAGGHGGPGRAGAAAAVRRGARRGRAARGARARAARSGGAGAGVAVPAPGRQGRSEGPQRGDKRELMVTVERNAAQALALHKTKRASDLTTRSKALQEIADALDLDTAPLRIECYDISHLQGQDVVASMVVFEDGLARKSEYRRFAIKGFEGQDDVRSMHEVITRRFRHQEQAPERDEETGRPRRFAYPPQLIVVDGGEPQVNAAQRALMELGVNDVALCGLAKRLEEVWLPGEDDPVVLPRSSEGLYLLQRVRDEAHRFAISYQRQKRGKRATASALDDLPGLGEARRQALLKHFGSVRKLRAATIDELCEVPGIGRRTAEAIAAALASRTPATPAVNMTTGEILEPVTSSSPGKPDADASVVRTDVTESGELT